MEGKRKIGEEHRGASNEEEEEFRRKENEEVDDDVCFLCKDGGRLLLCDYRNCHKGYHPGCVGKHKNFLPRKKSWICDLHFCFGCQKSPEFHCMCCPKALCSECVELVDFVQVQGEKGFCSVCLTLALHTEETANADSDSPLVALFRKFWEINNKRECLTVEDLRSSDARMKEGKQFVSSSDSGDYNKKLNDERISDSDNGCQKKKRTKPMKKGSKGKSPMVQRNKKSKRKEFVGWGSRVLIDFLKSIDIDVVEALPQKVVTTHITDYIKENNLFDPEKKKRIICDKKLQTVLGRKTVKESKISDLLDCHFVDNQLSSDEDATRFDSKEKFDDIVACNSPGNSDTVKESKISDLLDCHFIDNLLSSDEDAIRFDSKEKFDDIVACNSPGNSDTDGKWLERNKMIGCSIPQNKFASINPKNISLVYLRKGLVVKFMEEIETFDDKVVGSFVKFKTNPKERRFENPHSLVQVTGTTRTPTAEYGFEISLKALGVEKDICISMLSNGNITEEECYELKTCIQEGVLKHPTVAELQQKALDLHKDIVKHWISRELVMVQEHIDRARERGWKNQLHEHLERREWLQSSDVQEKLLNTFPQVVADEGSEITLDLFRVGTSETTRHESEEDRVKPTNIDESILSLSFAAKDVEGDEAVMNRDSAKAIKVGSDNDDGTTQRNYHQNGEKVVKGDPVIIYLSSSSEDNGAH